MQLEKYSSDKLLALCLKAKTIQKQWDIIQILHRRSEEEITIKCLNLLDAKEITNRRIAVDILAQVKNSKTKFVPAAILDRMATEKSPTVINAMLVSFSHLPTRTVKRRINEMLKFKNHRSHQVRLGLVFGLGMLNELLAVPALISLTNDKSAKIRNWATFTLGSMYKLKSLKITKALQEKLKDSDYQTRCEAIKGLAAQKQYLIVRPIILTELKSGRPGTLVFKAACDVRNEEILKALRDLRDKNVRQYRDQLLNSDWFEELEDAIKTCDTKSNGA